MPNLKNQRGVICDPVQVSGEWTIGDLISLTQEIAERDGVPAEFSEDTASTGGLFGKSYPCMIVKHPKPPQSYFEHWVVKNGSILNFYYGGMSKANYNNNMKEHHSNSGKLSGMLRGAMMKDMSMELQTEQMWHKQIMDIYQKVLFGED